MVEIYPGIYLTTEEKARKTLSQGSRCMPVGKEYTEQSILVNKSILVDNAGLVRQTRNFQPKKNTIKV